jgi:hypothetical protein
VRHVLRTFVALALVIAMVAFLGLPLCFSEACPMSAAERGHCKAMGRECCQTRGGQVAHAPALSGPTLATASALVSLAALAVPQRTVFADPSRAIALPAILQGVGLFTLFDVFLI